MSSRSALVFAILGLSVWVNAQDEAALLEKKATAASGKEKASILNQLANYYTYVSADKAIEYGQQACKAAKEADDTEEEIRALNNIGWGHRVAGRMETARDFYLQALPLAQKSKKYNLLFNTLNNIGGTYEESDDYPRALQYYQQTYELAKQNKWDKGVAVSLSYKAIVYTQQNNLEMALKCYLDALAIQERIGATKESAHTLHNMGHLYMNQDKCQKALALFQKALKRYEEAKDPRNISIGLNSIGCAYMCLHDLDRAVVFLKRALAIGEKIGFQSLVANAVGNLAIAYKDKGDFPNSLSYYQREKGIWEAMKNNEGIAKVHLNLGETYLKMKEYDKAFEHMNLSLKMARETGALDKIHMNLENLSELFQKKKDFRRALEYLQESIEIEKQIIDKESASKMAELEAKYEAESKKRQIDLLQKNNNIQKLMLSRARFRTFAFISGFALLLILLLLLFRQYLHLLAFWKKKNYVSHYKLGRLLGSGGMGMVWQATDVMGAGKTVALKVIREELAGEPSQRKRFLNESYLVDQIDHPNIVKVFERGEHEQNLYIAMEYLHGQSLGEIARSGEKLPLETILAIMRQLADVLSQLHRQGILHRDIKPENVIRIKDGTQVKLLDFGLAQAPSLTRLTETGEILGTVMYLSPELITERKTSPASDIYALGIVIYELLTLEKPFFGDNPGQIIRSILDTEALEPVRFRTDLPAEINALVMRMIAKDPDKRPSGEELQQFLDAKGFSAAANQ